ncbi:MAG TPA: nucleotidyltransferase family protein [Steroidobacteraceae bacterium]|jgi:molybdenum cofactor cytidylyltransferase
MTEPGAESPSLHVVVLAAGASTRFGSPKQLVRLNGRPLLHLAVSRAVEVAGQAVTVVLGANAAELAPLLRHTPAAVVINRDWAEGMGSSVRAGVARVPATADAVLLMLADQAAVTAEDLRRLVGIWRRQPQCIVAAHYAGTAGVPAIFPREDFSALGALRGDAGARSLLKRGGERVVRVPLQSAAIDIDTPEDLLNLQNP